MTSCKRPPRPAVQGNMRRILNFTLLAAAPLLLLGAQPKETCPYGPFEAVSPRAQQQATWHQVSMMAELVAPSIAADSAGSTRRRAIGAPATASSSNFIDTDVFAKMGKDGVAPTTMSTDAEFLRRVTLDLTGQIPDAATVQSFVADPAPDKRTKMIDQLLASDAFNDRWTMWFGDLVQNVQTATNSREYYYGRNAYYNYIKQSIHDGKPYDQMVREVLAGKGDSFALGTPDFVVRQLQPNGPAQDTYDNLAAQSGERFLGQSVLCLSCHGGFSHLELVNQYLVKKTRYDFWGMAAFFARTTAKAQPGPDPNNPNIRSFLIADNTTGAYQLNTTSGNKTPRAPAPGQPSSVTPVYMFTGEAPRPGEAYRDAYGRILTADRQFARATVNYLWKEMYGMGLVEPTNAFDLARLDPNNLPAGQTVQPVNPQLLEDLTTSFIQSGFSLRSIIRTMATSNTYQLSSVYAPGNWNEGWTPYFARHYPHRLQAEMLLDAVAKSTSVPVTYNVNGIGTVTRAMQLPDTTESRNNAYGRFLDELGRGDRDQTARTNDSSIAQALSLMNDRTIVVNRIHQATAGSTVAKVLASTTDPGTVVDQLYLNTLSRYPTALERQMAITYLKSGTLQQKTEDLQWVLINHLEFIFD
jgi:hypothetical protein